MKKKKLLDLIEVEWGIDNENMFTYYRRISEQILDSLLDFDMLEDWTVICTVYKNMTTDIDWYSCVVDWECPLGFKTTDDFVKYIDKIYKRAKEILNS